MGREISERDINSLPERQFTQFSRYCEQFIPRK